jgi:raffinose/stachyose/melibiose transport system substrate-binding protein
MRRSQFLALAGTVPLSMLAACANGEADEARSTAAAADGKIEPRPISWLLSRPANGPVIEVMQKIATEYAKEHPGFELRLITTPDRPSYIQKYVTLATADELPELFDTDATPFAQMLRDQHRMIDVEDLLSELGALDDFRPAALNYQRFGDGSLHMIPLEFGLELFWYNKALFEQAGVDVPTSLDDFPDLCRALGESGVVPITVNGKDQWPLERYLAFYPFRVDGEHYIDDLAAGKATFSDSPGEHGARWMFELGAAGAFEPGFSSVEYADAQALFTTGRAAMYNIGTWELPALATGQLPEDMQDRVGFFTLPTIKDGVTAPNEYVTSSGIGAAVNAKTYDPLVRDFLGYALRRYPKLYAATGVLGPTRGAPDIPDDALPLYQEVIDASHDLGDATLMPWDTRLDPTTNTRLQQELVLLVQGDSSVDKFLDTMNGVQRSAAQQNTSG